MRDGRFVIQATASLQDGLPDSQKDEAQIYAEQLMQGRRFLPIAVHTTEPRGLIPEFLARSR